MGNAEDGRGSEAIPSPFPRRLLRRYPTIGSRYPIIFSSPTEPKVQLPTIAFLSALPMHHFRFSETRQAPAFAISSLSANLNVSPVPPMCFRGRSKLYLTLPPTILTYPIQPPSSRQKHSRFVCNISCSAWESEFWNKPSHSRRNSPPAWTLQFSCLSSVVLHMIGALRTRT